MFAADFITETDKKYELAEQLREETGIRKRSYVKADDSKRLYLLIADAESAYAIATAVIEYSPSAGRAYAGDIAVREGYDESRYKGIALQLLIYKAQGLGMKKLTSIVSDKDCALYERNGFFPYGAPDNGSNLTRVALNIKSSAD